MSKLQYNETLEAIQKANKIVLTTHRSPDGDAVGSILGLYHFIRSLGGDVHAIVPDQFPEFLNWIPGTDILLHFDREQEKCKNLLEEADLIFSLDYNTMSRTGDALGSWLSNDNTPRIIIDHHRQPDEDFVAYVHDITASSTSQLVFDLIDRTGHFKKVNLDIAKALYTGILTDTGSFRFPSTSARTHEIVGKLMALGLQISEVYNNIYDNNSFDRLQLLGYTLSQKLRFHPELNMAYITLSMEEMKRFNFQPGDTEGFVNYALSIKGVKFSCIMKEDDEGKVKMSFRSKGDFDVNTFARKYFNGGGHLNAAGGRNMESLSATEKRFLEVTKKELL